MVRIELTVSCAQDTRATGALHPHLEGGIRDVPIVVPPIAVQGELLEVVAEGRRQMEQLANRIARQIDLLVERRQVLITGAVTGELEIPEVAA